MGVRAYLRARRERESALAASDLEGLAAIGDEPRSSGGDDHGGGVATPASGPAPATPVELPGADAGELAQMLGAALGGTPQISTGVHRLERPEQLSAEILAVLAQAGASAGEDRITVEPEQAELMLEQVRARIAELEGEEGSSPDPSVDR